MASPPEVTITTLNGKFRMEKSLTDNIDSLLALQGIGWVLRKTLSLATVTLHVKEYTAPDGHTHIDIEQFVTGGIKVEPEYRTLNWTESQKKDKFFGDLTGKSRLIKFKDIPHEEGQADAEYLNSNWDNGEGELRIQVLTQNIKAGWTVNQIWGFEVINGKRYHCHRCILRKGKEEKRARIVYEYLAPLD